MSDRWGILASEMAGHPTHVITCDGASCGEKFSAPEVRNLRDVRERARGDGWTHAVSPAPSAAKSEDFCPSCSRAQSPRALTG